MFKLQIRVAYRDVTDGNHVYHARYFDWMEMARNEVLRELGQPLIGLQRGGVLLPVFECSMRHHRPARYDDVVEILTQTSLPTRAQLQFDCRIERDGEMLAEGMTRHVATRLNGRPIRLPTELVVAIESRRGLAAGADEG